MVGPSGEVAIEMHEHVSSRWENDAPRYGRISGCDRESGTRESYRHTDHSGAPTTSCAPTRSTSRRSRTASHGSGQRPRHDGPRRSLAISPAYHTAITKWVDTLGPRGSDLHFHAHGRLEQTPLDGLYNLCHVVPSEGPRIRTGASSGPSKRYCRVFGGVSLTPQTLSRLTDAPITQGCEKPV